MQLIFKSLAFLALILVMLALACSASSRLLVDEVDDENDHSGSLATVRADERCMPEQFEIEGIETSPSVSYVEHFKWTFDGKNQKQFISVGLTYPVKAKFNLLYRFDKDEPMLYLFPKDQKWCRTLPIGRHSKKLRRPCIGESATKVGTVTVGSKLECNLWRREVSKHGMSLKLKIVENDSVPVYIHSKTGPLEMFHGFVSFFNFRKDMTIRPSKFVVPQVCSTSATSITREMLGQTADLLRVTEIVDTLTGLRD